MAGDWWLDLLWVLGAGVIGFLITASFAGKFRLRRQLFLIPYVVLSTAYISGYVLWSGDSVVDILSDNLIWGLIGAAILSVLLVMNVLKQPSSPRPEGAAFAVDLTWSGLIYGSVDGMLLGALPVLAVMNAFDELGWDSDIGSVIAVGVLSILASVLVSVMYHLGYPEFRGRNIRFAIIGLAVGSAGYVVTGNPVSVVASHAIMHIAAVAHGTEKTVQLPPHYST